MKKMDFNCFIGTWPFYKMRHATFKDLCCLHAKNGLDGGYVSITQAIFYNDPYEAELELASAIQNAPNYHHVMTINPTLPGWKDDLSRAVHELDIKGVRIVSGYHDYNLLDNYMDCFMMEMKNLNLPLFITMRILDERTNYMIYPKSIPISNLENFLKRYDVPVVLCNIRYHELLGLQDIILKRERTVFDCSGLKDKLFIMEELVKYGIYEKMVYGSLAPIMCLESTKLLLDMGNISQKTKDEILSGFNFFNKL